MMKKNLGFFQRLVAPLQQEDQNLDSIPNKSNNGQKNSQNNLPIYHSLMSSRKKNSMKANDSQNYTQGSQTSRSKRNQQNVQPTDKFKTNQTNVKIPKIHHLKKHQKSNVPNIVLQCQHITQLFKNIMRTVGIVEESANRIIEDVNFRNQLQSIFSLYPNEKNKKVDCQQLEKLESYTKQLFSKVQVLSQSQNMLRQENLIIKSQNAQLNHEINKLAKSIQVRQQQLSQSQQDKKKLISILEVSKQTNYRLIKTKEEAQQSIQKYRTAIDQLTAILMQKITEIQEQRNSRKNKEDQLHKILAAFNEQHIKSSLWKQRYHQLTQLMNNEIYKQYYDDQLVKNIKSNYPNLNSHTAIDQQQLEPLNNVSGINSPSSLNESINNF